MQLFGSEQVEVQESTPTSQDIRTYVQEELGLSIKEIHEWRRHITQDKPEYERAILILGVKEMSEEINKRKAEVTRAGRRGVDGEFYEERVARKEALLARIQNGTADKGDKALLSAAAHEQVIKLWQYYYDTVLAEKHGPNASRFFDKVTAEDLFPAEE